MIKSLVAISFLFLGSFGKGCICFAAKLEPEVQHAKFPYSVSLALQKAGNNRHSLEDVLNSYKTNSLEYRAACYLVANMPFHYVGGYMLSCDSNLNKFMNYADSSYYVLISGKTSVEQETDPLHTRLRCFSDSLSREVHAYRWKSPMIVENEQADISAMNGDFIRKQVDYCCKLRGNSQQLKDMSENDFFDYVLSYRSISDYPLITSAEILGETYRKYLRTDTVRSASSLAENYNRSIWWLRHCGGEYPFNVSIGWPEMFFSRNYHDCVDMAFYASQIFKACGWPAAVEYNIAYKTWNGCHYDVVVPSRRNGEWQSFSPETELPSPPGSRFSECLNIYRLHFAPQNDNPMFLRNKDEFVPEEFLDPCIEDVSSHYAEVCKCVLPLQSSDMVNNNLAYLASFQSHKGWIPVSWGIIDHKKGTVMFSNVITDNIYLPIVYDKQGHLVPFGTPFKISHVGKSGTLIKPESSLFEYLGRFS